MTNQLGNVTLRRFAYFVAGSPQARNVGVVRLVLGTLASAGLLLVGACNTTYLEQSKDEPQNAADIMRAADLRPRYPLPMSNVDTGGASPPRGFSFFGWSAPAPAVPQPSGSRDVEALAPVDPTQPSGSRDAAGGASGYTLNFENAPVSQVAKSVLGDILNVGYVIDPRVQGSISLSSGRPVEKKDMLYVLENALAANNLVMVRNASGYRIGPANEGGVGAVDEARGSDSPEPGFGLTVIPLQYVSGTTLSKLLEGFATRPGAIRTDSSGKLLIVVGTGSERQSAVDTVRSFDVDWLRGQSVGMYPVQNSTPEPIVGELEKIMDSGDSGLGHGLVKFQPVSRLNSILVVAAKPELLRDAQRWIYRLDEPSTSSASVKVYKVRYGDAKQIALLLQQIFVTNSGVSPESPTNEIAPGSGVAAMTAAQRLTGGVQPNSNGLGSSNGPGSSGGLGNSNNPGSQGESGATRTATAQFGGVPVATLNSELSALGQSGSGGPQLPDVRITADLINNSVLVYARPDEYKLIERTLIQLDRPKLQVAIDVTIAEVTLNDALNYGVQFFLAGGAVSNTVSGTIPSIVNNVATNNGSTATGSALSGGLNVIAGNPASPRVVINALSAITDVKILSNPSLVVVDNGDASLEVGDQVPVSTGSAAVLSSNNAIVNTIDYKNTGVILHVQPHVNYNGSVLLDIDQLVSEPTGPALTPTISTREVKSTISVTSGQTVLLGGMIQDNLNKSRSGIPILGQLPYVGAAFGTTSKTDVRTELIMFIRPTIIRDGADAAMVAEELRSKMRGGKIQATTLPSMLNILSRPVQ
ncbi:MAG: type II secretion system secretin GspD [Hyphomicrobiales bacterium]|nr:type II secretion system secretin GspD [Hyphomicrobiales bacterium]